MTSRETTALRALNDESQAYEAGWSDSTYRLLYGAIGWPWLLYSLWGGSKASKRRLLSRLDLPDDALPNLGSWKADTTFLHRIVDTIEAQRPMTVVELGASASTLVCARALQMNGGGQLHSFDQHAQFVSATNEWLQDFGVRAHIRHAPLRTRIGDWPGTSRPRRRSFVFSKLAYHSHRTALHADYGRYQQINVDSPAYLAGAILVEGDGL